MRNLVAISLITASACLTMTPAAAQDNYEAWPLMTSTFPSTGGGGFMIKGYDPVITGDKCVTTFMAVAPAPGGQVYYNIVEFDAAQAQGGTLCSAGKWRAMDGSGAGTTPLRVFIKGDVVRRSP